MCCLFGLIDYKGTLTGKQKSKMVSLLGTAAELRGTDATGIAYLQNDTLQIYKKPIVAHKMRFRIPNSSKVVMGHTRLATQGSKNICQTIIRPLVILKTNYLPWLTMECYTMM